MKTRKIIPVVSLIIFLAIPLAVEAGFFGGFLGGLLGNIGNQIIGGAVNDIIGSIGTQEIGEIVPSSLGGATSGGTGTIWTETPSDISSIINRTVTGSLPGMDQLPDVLRGPITGGISQGVNSAINSITGQGEGEIWETTPYELADNLPSTVSGLIQRVTALDSAEAAIRTFQEPTNEELRRGQEELLRRAQGETGGQTGPQTIVNPTKYKNFEELIEGLIVFLRNLALVVTPLIFVFAGYQFVFSQGEPQKVKTGQNMMLYAAVGLGLILIAEGIIELLKTMVLG